MPTLCLLCRTPLESRHPRVVDSETRATFAILACPSCGLGQTTPAPRDPAAFYGADYHGSRHGFTASLCAGRRLRRIQACAGKPRGRRLLDVGCGDGTLLLFARDQGWKVAGVEMNPAIARKTGLDVFATIEDARALAPYACITLWHVLEHLPEPRQALRTLRELLAPDGVLLVAVPDARSAQARLFGRHWLHLDVPRHRFHFGGSALRRLLDLEGFEVLRRYGHELEYDLMGWTQSASNVLLPVPNVFFRALTGKPAHAPTWMRGGPRGPPPRPRTT